MLKEFDRWPNLSTALLLDQGNFEYWGQRDMEAETVGKIAQQELKPQEMRDCLKKYNAAMAIEDIPLTCSSCGCRRHGDVTSFFNLADLSMFKLTPGYVTMTPWKPTEGPLQGDSSNDFDWMHPLGSPTPNVKK
ncbi:hypothetical protein HDU98_004809 [Podochytrium sp. JEL0797]|nr:hypothetical protein HDU98_004809 [Podochytrium sp. JEL0797]